LLSIKCNLYRYNLECGPALEALLAEGEDAEEVAVRDLPLTKAARMELVRRLVAAGVLAVVG
jgi:hypothetical protein